MLVVSTIKFKPYRLCPHLETEGWGQRNKVSWPVTIQSDQITGQVLFFGQTSKTVEEESYLLRT